MNMQAVRKIVDAGILDGIFTLPSAFANRRIEIVMRPVEDEPTGNQAMAADKRRGNGST
jgi:hypothetical protein